MLKSAVMKVSRVVLFCLEVRIALEEIGWSQLKGTTQVWHNWKVFLTRNVTKPHCVPHHYVPVLNIPIPAYQFTTPNIHHFSYQNFKLKLFTTKKLTSHSKQPKYHHLDYDQHITLIPISQICCTVSPKHHNW